MKKRTAVSALVAVVVLAFVVSVSPALAQEWQSQRYEVVELPVTTSLATLSTYDLIEVGTHRSAPGDQIDRVRGPNVRDELFVKNGVLHVKSCGNRVLWLEARVPAPDCPQGQIGEQGTPGKQGVQGIQGNPGAQGNPGVPGQMGPAGYNGRDGVTTLVETFRQTVVHENHWFLDLRPGDQGSPRVVSYQTPGVRYYSGQPLFGGGMSYSEGTRINVGSTAYGGAGGDGGTACAITGPISQNQGQTSRLVNTAITDIDTNVGVVTEVNTAIVDTDATAIEVNATQ